MSLRQRVLAFWLLAVLVLGAGGAYAVARHRLAGAAASGPGPRGTVSFAQLQADGPYLVFRNTARGPGYGRVAAVSAAAPRGPRVVLPATCDRVFARASAVLCLSAHQGVTTTYTARIYDAAMRSPGVVLPLAGIPSRARLSPDAGTAATTTFVSGDSYTSVGFSTRTVVSTLASGRSVDLEDFALLVDGRRVSAPDRNVWGVTFRADARTFYATVAYGGLTHLVRGDLDAQTLTVLRNDAECPSLSPDGTRVVFKQRGSLPAGRWRLVVYDLRTRASQELAETRSVDDQVEWTGPDSVAYGLPRSGADAAVSDVWTVAADGTGVPQVLVPGAWSPALVP